MLKLRRREKKGALTPFPIIAADPAVKAGIFVGEMHPWKMVRWEELPPQASPPAPEFFATPQSEALALPFSEAVRAGDFLFLSGQIGNLPGARELAAGGIGPEASQALEHIRAILERRGSSMASVVKCTVFLTDIKEWPAFNEVYRKHFASPYPARSALAASGLALGARVEVECIAYAPEKGPE